MFQVGVPLPQEAGGEKKKGKKIENLENQLRILNISLRGVPEREIRAPSREEIIEETTEEKFLELRTRVPKLKGPLRIRSSE